MTLQEANPAVTGAQAAATIGLIRSGLLKRFESSAFAFVSTLDTLINGHKIFLEALGKGHVVTTRFLREIAADDETALGDFLKASTDTFPARDFDGKKLREAVEADFTKLLALRANVAKVSPGHDPKLKVLVAELEKVAARAKEEATDAIDEVQRRKVLLFSFFADTVQYVRDFLRREVKHNPALAAYRKRVIAVTGDDDLEDVSRQDAIYGFAPISTEAPPGRDTDLYDVLVTTDVLAEGVNLQQCRNIINLDVPWNPMRLVQRHGRIDRIGSPHTRVFLRTIFPAERLDQLLNLEQRILAKIAMAAASIGVAPPVDGAAPGQQVFIETREDRVGAVPRATDACTHPSRRNRTGLLDGHFTHMTTFSGMRPDNEASVDRLERKRAASWTRRGNPLRLPERRRASARPTTGTRFLRPRPAR